MAEKQKTRIMINGLPGKMAKGLVESALESGEFEVIGSSLTGPEITDARCGDFYLIKPNERENIIQKTIRTCGPFISIDYTHPSAVNDNADFYCRHKLPFIMGTTGGDRKALEERVKASEICAVIAPNMAAPIVSLMDFMEQYFKVNSGALKDYLLEIRESHQYGKADTSGTAKAMVKYFNKLGIEFNEKDIKMIREPGAQLKLGVPENFLGGHGWHRYTINPLFSNRTEAIRNFANMFESAFLTENNPALKGYKFQRGAWENSATSADGNVYIGTINLENGGIILEHNINGRGVYVDGTLNLAVPHLARMIGRGEKGKVYSMIDVLKG